MEGQAKERRPRLAAIVGLALLIAVPGLLVTASGGNPPPATPPVALDRFLLAVRAALPPGARLLCTGTPPALLFYRATLLLYPHPVVSAAPTDYAHSTVAPSLSLSTLRRQARRIHARYLLLWNAQTVVPVSGGLQLILQRAEGRLVEVQS